MGRKSDDVGEPDTRWAHGSSGSTSSTTPASCRTPGPPRRTTDDTRRIWNHFRNAAQGDEAEYPNQFQVAEKEMGIGWTRYGVAGPDGQKVLLESFRLGGTRCTSIEAVQRFIDRLQGQPIPTPSRQPRTEAKRAAKAMEELRRRGYV